MLPAFRCCTAPTCTSVTRTDVTEFRLLHPSGVRIIDNYAGIDTSSAYWDSAVHAMATMYEIGRIAPIGIEGLLNHGSVGVGVGVEGSCDLPRRTRIASLEPWS